MTTTPPWLTKLRALLGAGLLGWEAVFKAGRDWWAFVLVVWLLGGPGEELIRLVLSGKIQIRVTRDTDEKEPPS